MGAEQSGDAEHKHSDYSASGTIPHYQSEGTTKQHFLFQVVIAVPLGFPVQLRAIYFTIYIYKRIEFCTPKYAAAKVTWWIFKKNF